jgi:hypothetical protein
LQYDHLRVVVRKLHRQVNVKAGKLSHTLLAVELLGGGLCGRYSISLAISTAGG